MGILKTLSTWTVILPAAGIILGWSLNEFSFWFRVRREERKTLRHILYNLLVLHGLLIRLNQSNMDNMIRRLIPLIPEFKGVKATDEEIILINSFLFHGLVSEVFGDNIVALRQQFQDSVLELSKIYPFSAYSLESSANIKSIFELIEKILIDMEKHFNPLGPPDPELDSFVAAMRNAMIDSSVKNLKTDIRYVSGKLGLQCRYQAWKQLKHLNSLPTEQSLTDAAQMLSAVITEFQKNRHSKSTI